MDKTEIIKFLHVKYIILTNDKKYYFKILIKFLAVYFIIRVILYHIFTYETIKNLI